MHCLLRAALVSVLLLGAVSAQTSVGDAYGLHPVCGPIQQAQLLSSSTTLGSYSTPEFSITCFSFSFNATNKSRCDTSAGKVVMKIQDSTTNAVQSIDIGQVFQGSLYAAVFRFANKQKFTIQASYPTYSSCPAVLYYSISGDLSRDNTESATPYVVNATPTVMYLGESYQMRFRSPVNVTPGDVAKIQAVLINGSATCDAAPKALQADPSAGAVALVPGSTRDLLWTTKSRLNGGLTVCMRTSSEKPWAIVSYVVAYGGNPVYYDFGLVSTSRNSPVSVYDITFYGNDLKASADRVRLIDASAQQPVCTGDARPTSGASWSALTQLTPNQTTTRVTFSSSNVYVLVCYDRSGRNQWVSVPNYGTLSRRVIQNVTNTALEDTNAYTTTATSTAAPATTTSSGQYTWITTCASAPIVPANYAASTEKVVRLTVTTTGVPTTFGRDVAALLCLPEVSDVVVFQVSASSVLLGHTDIFVRIACPMMACNNAERQAALNSKAASLPYVFQSALLPLNVAATDAAVAKEGDGDDHRKTLPLFAVIGALAGVLVISVTVFSILLVRRYRRDKRKTQITQGEVVEAEIIDMNAVEATVHEPYSNPSWPHSPVAVGYPPISAQSSLAQPAAIEGEESKPEEDTVRAPIVHSASTAERDERLGDV